MRRRISIVIAVVVCLALAQLGLTLIVSFNSRLANTDLGENWILKLYHPAVPNEAFAWLTHAIGIGIVIALAVTLRHRWGFGSFTSLLVAGAFGAVIIPFFKSIVVTAAFYEPDEVTSTFVAGLWEVIQTVIMTQRAMIAHTITAFITAGLGTAFGQHLTSNAPSGPNALGAIATRALAVIRRLPPRNPDAMLKAAEV